MPTPCRPHPCPLPPGELPDQIVEHAHQGFARTVFNSELDKYASSLFKMKCILCSCPGWTLIRPRLSFQASLCKESEEATGCLTGPGWFAAFGHQQGTTSPPTGRLATRPPWGYPLPEDMGGALAAPAHRHRHRTPTGAPPGWHRDPAHPRAPSDKMNTVSRCHHFSVPEWVWGHPTPLRCCPQRGQVPGRARGHKPRGRRSAATSTFNS